MSGEPEELQGCKVSSLSPPLSIPDPGESLTYTDLLGKINAFLTRKSSPLASEVAVEEDPLAARGSSRSPLTILTIR